MNTIELWRHVRQDPAKSSPGHIHINHRRWPLGPASENILPAAAYAGDG